MFAEATVIDSISPFLLMFISLAIMLAIVYVPQGAKWAKEWVKERKEHEQKVEALLTEIRDALRQKP